MRLIDADEWKFRLEEMLPNMIDEKDKQSVRFALNIFDGEKGINIDNIVNGAIADKLQDATSNCEKLEKQLIERDNVIDELKERIEYNDRERRTDMQALWEKIAYHKGRADAYEYAAELFFDRDKAEAKKVMRDAAD